MRKASSEKELINSIMSFLERETLSDSIVLDKTNSLVIEMRKNLDNLMALQPALTGAEKESVIQVAYEVGALDKLTTLFEEKNMVAAVNTVLSKARHCTIETIKFLHKHKILSNEQIGLLFHYAPNAKYIDDCVELYGNNYLNARNHENKTPLHSAVENKALEPLFCLLHHGADSSLVDSNNNSVWDSAIVSPDKSIAALGYFHKHPGILLSPLPVTVKQQGPCCGLYSLASARRYLEEKDPGAFSKPALPARKRDQFKSFSSSLRFIAKNRELTRFGEIAKHQSLVALAKENDCQARAFTCDDPKQAGDIIKSALANSMPVIIGYNVSMDDGVTPKSNGGGHWAMIAGYVRDPQDKIDYFLLVQNNEYYRIPIGQVIFSAWYFSSLSAYAGKWCKLKKGEDWVALTKERQEKISEGSQTIVIPPSPNRDPEKKTRFVVVGTRNTDFSCISLAEDLSESEVTCSPAPK